jgi:hypothetical protein
VRHPFLDAPDHHRHRRTRGQREVAESRQREREGDRHAAEHCGTDDAKEEDEQVDLAQPPQRRPEQVEDANQQRDGHHGDRDVARLALQRKAQQRGDHHQRAAQRDGDGAPEIADLERRRGDHRLVLRVLPSRPHEEQQKSQRGDDADHLDQRLRLARQLGDDRRHAHVRTAPQRHHRAEHGEPKEQRRRKFVGPGQRRMEDVARHHPAEQHDDFGENQRRREILKAYAQNAVERADRPLPAARIERQGNRR